MILYRTESFSGSGEREAEVVMSFEVFELMNTDILDTLSEGILKDHPIAAKLRELSTNLGDEDFDGEIPECNDEEALGLCREILEAVEEVSGVKVKYALWLTTKDSISSYYGKDMDGGCDYSAYETGPVVLSDCGEDGALYGYTEMPEPLDIPLEPIVVTNDGWAK